MRLRFTLTVMSCMFVAIVVESGHAVRAVSSQDQTIQDQRTWPAGATITVLSDGRELVIGGRDGAGAVGTALIHDPSTGQVQVLPSVLNRPRAEHSATVLSDGTIVILGGIGEGGQLEASAERFNPATQTFTIVPFAGNPRARHTTTLLTDGRLLIVGGQGADDETRTSADVWDPIAGRVEHLSRTLNAPRAGHEAILQPDGTVRIVGGSGLPDDEVYLPGPDVFVPSPRTVRPLDAPYLARSIPEHRAQSVALDSGIALHFSRRVDPRTIGPESISLASSSGALRARFVVAEQGLLVFIRPVERLTPGDTHTVVLRGLRDVEGAEVPFASISFTTAGSQRVPPAALDDESWIPGLNSDGWRTGRPASPWQQLPALRAPAGTTALAGQVLRLNGTPLADVTLEMEGRSVRSDRTGRFLLLLSSLDTGHYELKIRGATASHAGKVYGFFEAGVRITAGDTTVLPFTIWMPVIDTAHAVTIPSPTTEETVITTPRIPGLELRLPRGTVIRDEDGQRVRQVSLTPIPVDRPPFPLPANVEVPIYFTIQPGGAYVAVYGKSTGGARLIYPNYTKQPVGTRMDFWHYTPEERGWYVYGRGAVEQSGRQVVPDPGVSIYEFTGAMISFSWNPPSWWPSLEGFFGGDPVDLATGLFVYEKTDVFLPDVIPIVLTRTYRQGDSVQRPFGIGTMHPYDINLWRPTGANYNEAALVLPDGARVKYVRTSPDPGTSFVGLVLEHTASPSVFYKSTITWNGNGWDLKLKNGTVLVFGDNLPLQEIRDKHGNSLKIVHTAGQSGLITRLVSPHNRWVTFTYDAAFRVSSVTDNLGRTASYTYDASGRLWKATDFGGGVTEYTYDTSHRMLTIKDPRGITYLTNEYDTNGRVYRQTQANTGVFEFEYTLDGSRVTQTEMTDPRGYVHRATFNSDGYFLTFVEAVGTSKQRTTTATRQTGSQFITSLTDGLNRRTDFTHDANGNVTTETRLAGTSDAVTRTFTYEPAYQQIASVTDPLTHTTAFSYDYLGRLTTVTDPLSHQTNFTYNPAGQVVTITNGLNHTTTLGYDMGDLVSVTDPLSRTTQRLLDGGGRLIQTIDPGGRTTKYEYGALNQLTKIVDALNGQTTFTYDGNGNVLTLTDARGKTTTWTYNNMDYVATRTDPLTRQETFTYDLDGNLTTWTDRKSKVMSYSYDELSRATFAGFDTTGGPPSYASTTTTTYDAGNRPTQVVDSSAGTITRTYDLLDRLTQEVTPEGTITYTYDAAGRRATMQVAGQTSVSYTYDNADRLTAITQGSSTVSMGYDDANRRTSLTLPNGIVTEYTYDNASQLTGLTYKLSGTPIGTLAYTYDAAGQPTGVDGTYARTNLPAGLTSATYDDANHIATWGGTSFSYDNNGNLTSDATRTYTWNARNQLSAISGPVSATFAYDGFGRRRAKTVSGTTTQFLYDGLNSVQELASGTATANILAGSKIDEYFRRIDTSATRFYLGDALGSTIALADTAGAVQTSYTYEPFGGFSVSGAPTTNAIAFTGREADGTGLFFYRARYYDPRLQRFAGEDPFEFFGGINMHVYAGNAPTRYRDPLGLKPSTGVAGSLGGQTGGSSSSPNAPPPPPGEPDLDCWQRNFDFSWRAADTSLFDVLGIDVPGWVKSMPLLPDRPAEFTFLGGATARFVGTVSLFDAGVAFWRNGGWVANLSPRQVVVSAGINTALAGTFGYYAYYGGAAIGAAAYATAIDCWKLSMMFEARWVKATGQHWKLVILYILFSAAVLLAIGSAVPSIGGLLTQDRDLLLLCGGMAAAGGLAWMGLAFQCPKCGRSVGWWYVCNTSVLQWFTAFTTASECPVCRCD